MPSIGQAGHGPHASTTRSERAARPGAQGASGRRGTGMEGFGHGMASVVATQTAAPSKQGRGNLPGAPVGRMLQSWKPWRGVQTAKSLARRTRIRQLTLGAGTMPDASHCISVSRPKRHAPCARHRGRHRVRNCRRSIHLLGSPRSP